MKMKIFCHVEIDNEYILHKEEEDNRQDYDYHQRL